MRGLRPYERLLGRCEMKGNGLPAKAQSTAHDDKIPTQFGSEIPRHKVLFSKRDGACICIKHIVSS